MKQNCHKCTHRDFPKSSQQPRKVRRFLQQNSQLVLAPLVLNTEYTINAGYINSGYSTITTGNTGFNYMYANGSANLPVSNEIYELRETVRQLRREIDEIKRQLNTVQESKNVESHRKIAVQ